jgi:hypothetical protein
MEPGALSLSRLRVTLGQTWLIVLFGIAYLISQVTILVIVEPLGGQFAKLQCFGFSAETYFAVFRHWEETGVMAAYKAHFVLDNVHWIWYAAFFTFLLCRLFESNQLSHRLDWVLLLPLASGLFDWYENKLQNVFLGSPDFSTIVDPLPLLSTIASDIKWTLALTYVLFTLVLLFRGRSRAASEPAA